MDKIKNVKEVLQFNKEIYLQPPIYVTCDQFWDGGIAPTASLKEKTEFYLLADKMAHIVQDVIAAFGKVAFIGKSLCRDEQLYAHWSDLKEHKLFQELSEHIQPRGTYKISLPEDDDIVDLIVESNFKYLSHIALYIPTLDLVCIPTCHTEIIIYAYQQEEVMRVLESIIAKYSDENFKIVCKQ